MNDRICGIGYHFWPNGRGAGASCQCGSDWYEKVLVEKVIRRTTDPTNAMDRDWDHGVVHPITEISRAAAPEAAER